MIGAQFHKHAIAADGRAEACEANGRRAVRYGGGWVLSGGHLLGQERSACGELEGDQTVEWVVRIADRPLESGRDGDDPEQ